MFPLRLTVALKLRFVPGPPTPLTYRTTGRTPTKRRKRWDKKMSDPALPSSATPVAGPLEYESDSTALSAMADPHGTHGSVLIPRGHWMGRLLAFVGPAYLVSVGYMDPGNWATDLQGGALFGYRLIWVLAMSNVMAILLQTLAARLGLVTGRDLAQACRESYSTPVRWCLFVCARSPSAPATWRRCSAPPSASTCSSPTCPCCWPS